MGASFCVFDRWLVMEPLTLQPTFVVDIALPPDELMPRMRQVCEGEEFRDRVETAGNCIEFRIDKVDQRFWSPHLSVMVSAGDAEGHQNPTGPDHSKLFCRFSPRPEIWTMFMAIYAVIIGVIFICSVYGYVQWILGDSPLALLVVPLGVCTILLMHAGSKVGQKLSTDQMHILSRRLTLAVERAGGGQANG